jgi:predicted RNA-binding protein YlxR (DUF448 family)
MSAAAMMSVETMMSAERSRVAHQGLKHVPERTCVVCRKLKPKRQLIRLVYSSSTGVVEVDESGRKPGRGAYLCSTRDCWGKRLTKNRLEQVLRGRMSAENWAYIVRFGAELSAIAEERSHEVGVFE